jgi:hypothetical protein
MTLTLPIKFISGNLSLVKSLFVCVILNMLQHRVIHENNRSLEEIT